jgi:hypothetical protein
MTSKEDQKRLEMEDAASVVMELDDSLAMILLGLEALVTREGRPRSLDAAMQNLAPGFERLLKLTYILAQEHLHASRPDLGTMKRFRHDLLSLLDQLLDAVNGVPGYSSRPVVVADTGFLRGDPGLRSLLDVLGHFGNYGRYARIDDLVSTDRVGADGEPSRRWEEIEQDLVWARPDVDAIVESMDILTPATFEVSLRLQRLARAISRIWVFGGLGEDQQIHYGVLSKFAALDDANLGEPLGTG